MNKHFSFLPKSFKNYLEKQIIVWRRQFHQYPEPAWCEFNTASVVAGLLKDFDYQLVLGKDLLSSCERMGLPDEDVLNDFFTSAQNQKDSHRELLQQMKGGYTAVAGILKNGEGPTVLFRFDMDALPLRELDQANHFPVQQGFRSTYENYMHACGHDGHTAIGLGLAFTLKELKEHIRGKIILLFQPAEEGLRGATALVNNSLFANIDYGYGFHLWANKPVGQLICGTNGQLASSKFDVFITGKAAHAGLNPEDGINAMLPAAEIVLVLEELKKSYNKDIKLNVGMLEGGSGRNIICSHAKLCIETRAINSKLNQKLYTESVAIIEEKANKYNCKFEIKAMGYADAANCNKKLAEKIQITAQQIPYFSDIRLIEQAGGNSEDFTVFINHIQESGGQATYMGVGAGKNAGAHHTSNFDINEKTFIHVVDLLTGICFNDSHV
ncbi:MAG: amidohydrolase [Bacteroidales bacterium]|nr:amidohydrolase [Bacteroidales bacterium]